MDTTDEGAPLLEWLEDGTPYSARYRDVYRPRNDLGQSDAVFIKPCGLPERWRAGEPVHVLETGFGLGINLTAAVHSLARHGNPGASLRWTAVELHPVDAGEFAEGDVERAIGSVLARAYAGEKVPVEVPILGERLPVTLRIEVGDAAEALRRIDGPAMDAVFLDGFSPDRNPALWTREVFEEAARLTRSGARLATWSVAGSVRDGLARAGFDVERLPGYGKKRHRLVGVRR